MIEIMIPINFICSSAMGYPEEKKNNPTELGRYLNSFHHGCFAIFNCSQSKYDTTAFNDQVHKIFPSSFFFLLIYFFSFYFFCILFFVLRLQILDGLINSTQFSKMSWISAHQCTNSYWVTIKMLLSCIARWIKRLIFDWLIDLFTCLFLFKFE